MNKNLARLSAIFLIIGAAFWLYVIFYAKRSAVSNTVAGLTHKVWFRGLTFYTDGTSDILYWLGAGVFLAGVVIALVFVRKKQR